MLPERVSNPGPLTYESGALPIALRGPATSLTSNHLLQNQSMTFLSKVSVLVINVQKIPVSYLYSLQKCHFD